jgi:hypothetical protein
MSTAPATNRPAAELSVDGATAAACKEFTASRERAVRQEVNRNIVGFILSGKTGDNKLRKSRTKE